MYILIKYLHYCLFSCQDDSNTDDSDDEITPQNDDYEISPQNDDDEITPQNVANAATPQLFTSQKHDAECKTRLGETNQTCPINIVMYNSLLKQENFFFQKSVNLIYDFNFLSIR